MTKEEQRGNTPAPGDWGPLVVPDAEPLPETDMTNEEFDQALAKSEPVRIEPKSVKVDKSASQ